MDFLQELQSLGVMVLVTSRLPLNLHPNEGPPLCLGPLPPPVRPPSLCFPQHRTLVLKACACFLMLPGRRCWWHPSSPNILHPSVAPAEPGPLDVCSAASGPLCTTSHTHGAHKLLIFPSCQAGIAQNSLVLLNYYPARRFLARSKSSGPAGAGRVRWRPR